MAYKYLVVFLFVHGYSAETDYQTQTSAIEQCFKTALKLCYSPGISAEESLGPFKRGPFGSCVLKRLKCAPKAQTCVQTKAGADCGKSEQECVREVLNGCLTVGAKNQTHSTSEPLEKCFEHEEGFATLAVDYCRGDYDFLKMSKNTSFITCVRTMMGCLPEELSDSEEVQTCVKSNVEACRTHVESRISDHAGRMCVVDVVKGCVKDFLTTTSAIAEASVYASTNSDILTSQSTTNEISGYASTNTAATAAGRTQNSAHGSTPNATTTTATIQTSGYGSSTTAASMAATTQTSGYGKSPQTI